MADLQHVIVNLIAAPCILEWGRFIRFGLKPSSLGDFIVSYRLLLYSSNPISVDANDFRSFFTFFHDHIASTSKTLQCWRAHFSPMRVGIIVTL
jgi:hypothetical protein